MTLSSWLLKVTLGTPVWDGSPSIAKELCVVRYAYLLKGNELFCKVLLKSHQNYLQKHTIWKFYFRKKENLLEVWLFAETNIQRSYFILLNHWNTKHEINWIILLQKRINEANPIKTCEIHGNINSGKSINHQDIITNTKNLIKTDMKLNQNYSFIRHYYIYMYI